MEIDVDKSRIPSGVPYFLSISSIEMVKDDLFKLGIFKHEAPPEHVHDSDFLYLMSKVTAYIQLYSDFITVEGNSIVNTSTDDRVMKDVSEIVGIALGIKLTIDSFGVRQERISKIPPPSTKQKYLDYKFVHKGRKIEFETKGTTSSSIEKFVDDITKKKSTSTTAHFRYGTVAILSKPGKSNRTELHICDDPPEHTNDKMAEDDTPWHYISALGYLLDNTYYNEYVRAVLQRKEPRKKFIKIKERFFGRYLFQHESYLGEFFDFRVNIENLSAVISGREQTIDEVFRKVTKAQGKKKIFIGIHSNIVDLVLKGKGLDEIIELQFKRLKGTGDSGVEILRDSDGIIVVIAPDRIDHQIEKQFPEDEVKKRIGQMVRLGRHESTECGSPCRSRDKAGKPCEIRTYRGACHFHR